MIEELDSSLDKVDLVMLRDVKDYLRKMVRCSITRRTAFSKFVGLQRSLDRLRLYLKIARVKSCQDSNVSIDEKPARG
jgi:hypothetical protein